jgi:uncharacterized protein (DUF1330 family)
MSVDEEPIIMEGDRPYTMIVLMTFPSEEEARCWFESEDYQKLVRNRRKASESNIVMIERRRR